ncbi:MAG: hypothetical protein ACLVH0_04290 [Coprococcus eutactus]
MLFTETPDISNIQAAWLPLLYAGLLSCGVGYTLQISRTGSGINPVIASLVMSLESVISGPLAGWVILGQVLSPKRNFRLRIDVCGNYYPRRFPFWKQENTD